jgi:hypothetical protein
MNRDGKVAKRAGESEDLPCHIARTPRPLKNIQFFYGLALRTTETGHHIKKGQETGCSPSSRNRLKGFFIFTLNFHINARSQKNFQGGQTNDEKKLRVDPVGFPFDRMRNSSG